MTPCGEGVHQFVTFIHSTTTWSGVKTTTWNQCRLCGAYTDKEVVHTPAPVLGGTHVTMTFGAPLGVYLVSPQEEDYTE